jgi:hypothetical protein
VNTRQSRVSIQQQYQMLLCRGYAMNSTAPVCLLFGAFLTPGGTAGAVTPAW